MRLVEHQLKEQESFILGIKLNLANLNKNYMEQRSQLKREQLKSATYAVEKKNLQNCLLGVKLALEETQAKLSQKYPSPNLWNGLTLCQYTRARVKSLI